MSDFDAAVGLTFSARLTDEQMRKNTRENLALIRAEVRRLLAEKEKENNQ